MICVVFFMYRCNNIYTLGVILIEHQNMDQEIFKETVFILKDEMYRLAKNFVKSNDEAQDVVQDLMVKLWQTRDTLPNYSNLKAFVLRCVRNDCLNRLKHENVKQGFVQLQLHTQSNYNAETNNLKDEIVGFIRDLPEKQRLVIHMKDVEEYEIKEIAQILEMEENAVRVNLNRAREKIRVQITQLMEYEKRQIKRSLS